MEWNSPSPCPNTLTIRRNPHRKARPTPTAAPSAAALKSSSDPSFPEIRSFSIDDVLSPAVLQKPQAESSAATPEVSNIKVYLRIRSLKRACEDRQPKLKPKNAWPRNPAKKKIIKEIPAKRKETGSCIMIGEDSHSVTLTPSTSLQESKRIKSEVFDGFSHVFSGDSTQDEIFSEMMSPIVDDFLKGRSVMLAALGPTGSGKTYTVFGTPKEPGMVPLALQRIFEQTKSLDTKVSRKFVLSIFEIYSEGGRGERMRDLFQDGSDLCLQQSNIKALHEVVIHDATEAELLVGRAMLKRSTAMTNVNSQSSRSQCLINLRCIFGGSDGESDLESNSAILTIVDLAGAERERRTGNQGSRLLESNFINNTSMVFGLCLRSLLEHQKNPKKPLQKHCQNSLLTRFLQDYLEGKKRMTLILAVKSGEDDYLDSSHLLRQASPYTKIKFTSSEEQQKMVSTKRPSQSLFSKQQPKKLKCSNRDVCEIEENTAEKENELPVKDLEYTSQPNSCPEDLRKSERDYQIMKHLARAFLKVLRQHSEKLKVADDEIQNLRESLVNEKTRSLELEKRLTDLKTCTACAKKGLNPSKPDNVLLSTTHHDGHASFCTDEENLDVQNRESMNPTMCNVSAEHHEAKDNQELEAVTTLDVQSELCSSSTICSNSAEQHHEDPSQMNLCNNSFCVPEKDKIPENQSALPVCNSSAEQHHGNPSQINLGVESECNSSRTSDVSTEQHHEESSQARHLEVHIPTVSNSCVQNYASSSNQNIEINFSLESNCNRFRISDGFAEVEQHHGDLSQVRHLKVDVPSVSDSCVQNYSSQDVQVKCTNLSIKTCECISDTGAPDDSINLSHVMSKDVHPSSDVEGHAVSSSDLSDSSTNLVQETSANRGGTLDLPKSTKKTADTGGLETSNMLNVKPLSTGKPRRRLQPASSVLLKDVSTFDMEDEIDKAKGNRGKKPPACERERHQTQGSMKLVRLLKSTLPL